MAGYVKKKKNLVGNGVLTFNNPRKIPSENIVEKRRKCW